MNLGAVLAGPNNKDRGEGGEARRDVYNYSASKIHHLSRSTTHQSKFLLCAQDVIDQAVRVNRGITPHTARKPWGFQIQCAKGQYTKMIQSLANKNSEWK